jgi:hypothetical protein
MIPLAELTTLPANLTVRLFPVPYDDATTAQRAADRMQKRARAELRRYGVAQSFAVGIFPSRWWTVRIDGGTPSCPVLLPNGTVLDYLAPAPTGGAR